MYIVSFNPQNNPRSKPWEDSWGQGWAFESLSDPHTVSLASPSLNLLKILPLVCIPAVSTISTLQMRNMRLREHEYLVIISDSGRTSCCKLGLISSGKERRFEVSSTMWSCLVPTTGHKGPISFHKWAPLEEKWRKGKLLRSPNDERIRKPMLCPCQDTWKKDIPLQTSLRMSKVVISFLTSWASCED